MGRAYAEVGALYAAEEQAAFGGAVREAVYFVDVTNSFPERVLGFVKFARFPDNFGAS